VTVGKWVWGQYQAKNITQTTSSAQAANIMDVLGFTKGGLKGPKRNRWEGKKG